MRRINIEDYPITTVGSVKNIRVVSQPTDTKMGEAIFEFTNDTSVKDFGKLGFQTPKKGESMCATAVYNFKRLAEHGMPNLFIDQVSENAILVNYVRVIDPEKINGEISKVNRVFPIEAIARDVVTATSSARNRLVDGSLSFNALGLSDMPTEYPVFLPKTYVDGSTKLRPTDEYLPMDHLKLIARASTTDMNTIDTYLRNITRYAQERGSKTGFLVFDHKVEFAYDNNGQLVLADVPLCLDELTGALVGQFSDLDDFRGKPFRIFQAGKVHENDAYVNASKQLFRDHYDAAHPEWASSIKQKLKAGVAKKDLPRAPQPPETLVAIVSNIYQAFANEWTGERHFDVPSLANCVATYKSWAIQNYELR